MIKTFIHEKGQIENLKYTESNLIIPREEAHDK